jgi:hypothetical protein
LVIFSEPVSTGVAEKNWCEIRSREEELGVGMGVLRANRTGCMSEPGLQQDGKVDGFQVESDKVAEFAPS